MAKKPKTARQVPKADDTGGISDAGGKAIAAARGGADSGKSGVPGPSENSATNLIIHDIAMRAGGRLLRHTVEKGLLRGRYGGAEAKAIVENRSLAQTLMAGLVARYATRSFPAAALVGGGLLVKTLLDRSQSRRQARRAGDQSLAKQAKE